MLHIFLKFYYGFCCNYPNKTKAVAMAPQVVIETMFNTGTSNIHLFFLHLCKSKSETKLDLQIILSSLITPVLLS